MCFFDHLTMATFKGKVNPPHYLLSTFTSLLFIVYLNLFSITVEPSQFSLTSLEHQNSFNKLPHTSKLCFLFTIPHLADKNKLFHLQSSSILNFTNSNHSWLCIVLISSGDLQLNPGPRSTRITKFPCGVCQKACTKNQYAVACDSCDVWYHTKCMAMNSGCYRALSNISWHCCACGLPNFNSSLFLDWNNNASVQNSCVNPFNTLNLSNSNYSHSPLNTSNSSPRPVSTPNHKKAYPYSYFYTKPSQKYQNQKSQK